MGRRGSPCAQGRAATGLLPSCWSKIDRGLEESEIFAGVMIWTLTLRYMGASRSRRVVVRELVLCYAEQMVLPMHSEGHGCLVYNLRSRRCPGLLRGITSSFPSCCAAIRSFAFNHV